MPIIESATIAPIIDTYYYIFSPEEIPDSIKSGHTFTSIPLSLFFIIGLGYLFWRFKTKKIVYGELMIFVWYLSVYITLTPLLESYNSSKNFLPMIFPMALIMSYGLWRFIENFSHNKTKIFFFILTMCAHAVTFLIFWKIIYFEPLLIRNLPSFVNFREALLDPYVIFLGIVYIIVFSLILIYKFKLRNSEETTSTSNM